MKTEEIDKLFEKMSSECADKIVGTIPKKTPKKEKPNKITKKTR